MHVQGKPDKHRSDYTLVNKLYLINSNQKAGGMSCLQRLQILTYSKKLNVASQNTMIDWEFKKKRAVFNRCSEYDCACKRV